MSRVLFLIEDGPYRLDQRVRREAATLRSVGLEVSVVAPGPSNGLEVLDGGVEVHSYCEPSEGVGALGLIREYGVSLSRMSRLVARIYRKQGFEVIHAANPPDLLWMVAAPYIARGVKYVFDMHDPVPELFRERFGEGPRKWLQPAVNVAEQVNIRLADRVITSNDSLRALVLKRGSKPPECVYAVPNGPDLSLFDGVEAARGAAGRLVVGYLGNMNPQDGLEELVEMIRLLRERRSDVDFLLVGGGTRLAWVEAELGRLDLLDCVQLTGRMEPRRFLPLLAGVDVCVQPDPPTELNHLLTMTKTSEYMALGKPVVAFPLRQTRRTFQDACLYATEETARGLANAVHTLLDDPALRASLGERGRELVFNSLAWNHRRDLLLKIYGELVGSPIDRRQARA